MFRAWFPSTLRAKLLLLSLVVVAVPIITAGYVIEIKGRNALNEEKQDKLFGLTRILDSQLAGDFDGLLADYQGKPDDRVAKIAYLNGRLRAITDAVADANPGVGVGYYCKALNAIVTYGPSRDYADKVGLPISPDHPGRRVMTSGEPLVESGLLVRGHIMNAMWPIRRNGEVIGYIWANELSDAIERQTSAMDHAIFVIIFGGVLLGGALVHVMSIRISRDVSCIKNGLATLGLDIRKRIAPLPGEFGEIVAAINAMARALADARTLNENIVNSVADGIIAVDNEGLVTSINTAAQQMMNAPLETSVGQPYQSLFRPGAKFTSVLLDTLQTGKQYIGVDLVHPLATKTLHVSASSSVLLDGSGAVIGAVVVIKDLSEKFHLQTQIMRADRLAALGELMAGIAHEIRNPLTSIRGFMQHLESSDDIAEWQLYAPLVIRQVDSLNRIITELLEFGRYRPPRIGFVALNALIREVTMLAGNKWSTEIAMELSPDVPPIEADGEALKQVVLNLVLNAIQATSEGGRIIIRTAFLPPDQVSISVSDDGVGIAPEDLEKVFDPFFSTKPTGTGLGLAMVRRIIDAHDGHIGINSTLGLGTEITLRLPLSHKTSGDEA
ncbi:two-component system sensor histidine kinase AtoS [Telmatospirillum siberiense]|uniref:histidine kinase n=1 Tax=Telmatospirillum siberiense TaxID=382514 RepID=A0A2N3PVQ9_9PROT|nr:two-component system sensor histidine kinase AtoS [Telmatospirillum siberiense]PKU24475.1 two-component system sensor histidine kinase AtoS [Telmatospirillum siberiense]